MLSILIFDFRARCRYCQSDTKKKKKKKEKKEKPNNNNKKKNREITLLAKGNMTGKEHAFKRNQVCMYLTACKYKDISSSFTARRFTRA